MATFFVTEVRFDNDALVAARVCTPVPTGASEAPDHALSTGSVLALPELTALVEIAEVQLAIWNGPGPTDWFPSDQLVAENGLFISANEAGTPTDSLQKLKKIAAN